MTNQTKNNNNLDRLIDSVLLCFECNSQNDPNCEDPFDFSPERSLYPSSNQNVANNTASPKVLKNETKNQNANNVTLYRKRLPPVSVCHGCCVKLTSKLADGSKYLNINFK